MGFVSLFIPYASFPLDLGAMFPLASARRTPRPLYLNIIKKQTG